MNIDVVHDIWVPNPSTLKFFDPPSLLDGYKVFDLCLHSGEWDRDFN